MGDLIGPQRATAASMVGPTEHPGLEEGPIHDQLTAALEQVDEARLAFRSYELVRLLDRHPRHPPALGGQRVAGAHHRFFLHEELLVRSLPVLKRHNRGSVHR